MTPGEKAIINGLSNMSEMIRDITTKPYIQEIKKAGVFSMLFSGAQITSCSVLVNNIPSQNLYEGVRFHKVHEVSIMYIMLSTILQWFYFDTNSLERWLSLAFCIIVNVYFLIYELYIYYDMIKYPVAQIGNQKYEFYAIRYGSYLKNIRYEEYDVKY